MNDTTKPDNLEAVLRRVQKLLAIANDNRANPAEAAAAASQAENIMRKYQIEHADVIGAALKRDDQFGHEDIGGSLDPQARGKQTNSWAGCLALAIGRLNDCRVVWARTQALGVCLRFQGFKADAQVAVWTHLYVVAQMARALRAYQRAHPEIGRRESHDFRMGFVYGVVDNIEQAIKDKQAAMAAAVESRALVVSKANAVAQRFGEQRTRSGNSRGGYSHDRGYTEGRKVDVTRRGVEGTSSSSSTTLIAG